MPGGSPDVESRGSTGAPGASRGAATEGASSGESAACVTVGADQPLTLSRSTRSLSASRILSAESWKRLFGLW